MSPVQKSRRILRSLSLFLTVAALVVHAYAEESPIKVSLQGKVLDPARAPIAGATVKAILDGRSAGPSTVTDQAGEFSLSLEPGIYAVTVVAEGFDENAQTVELTAAGHTSLSVTLQIAALHNSINVVAFDYRTTAINSAMKTLTPLRDVPQSITLVTREQINDQLLSSIGDVVRYTPGITAHQGENIRDQI